MKHHLLLPFFLISIPLSTALADSSTVSSLLLDYANQGAGAADAEQGKMLWQETFNNDGERSCVSCHTKDLSRHGKHIKTGKDIKPMSPSANPERLTDSKKINKWFKRNCKWTLGRECSAQEKANILLFIEKS